MTGIQLSTLNNWGHERIRNARLPIICWTNTLSHYVVAFGSKYRIWNWDVFIKVFGKKITITRGSMRTDKWLLIHDNGAETSKNSYEPFWRNDLLSFDLLYGVYKIY